MPGKSPKTPSRPTHTSALPDAVRAAPRRGIEPATEETRRLAALQKLRDLLLGPQPFLSSLCRIAVHALGADAAGFAYISDRFLYFTGRHGALPERDIRVFAMSDLDRRIWIVPDVRVLPGSSRVNSFNGKFASYRSLIAVPVQFEGQTVAILVCCSTEERDTYSAEGKACLQELSYLAEGHLLHQATLASISRDAITAIERGQRSAD